METQLNEASLRAALDVVMDPELGAPITTLGMVPAIDINGSTVTVHIALTTAGCPLKHELKTGVQAALLQIDGVETVHLEFGEMDQQQRSAVMDIARKVAQERAPATMIPRTTQVVAIASGKGGVGKSSVTANLAAAFALQGKRVGVLDADIAGFSIPQMFGVDSRLGGHDGKIDPITVPIGSGILEIVSMGFLMEDSTSALMWRGLMLAKAVEQFLTDVRWGDLDVLLIDLPPGTGDIQMALARLLPQTGVVVVTTPARIAQEVATRVADMARKSHLTVLGVIENMSVYVDASGVEHSIFGTGGGSALAEHLAVPLLGSIPIQPAVASSGDGALPVVVTEPDNPASKAFSTLTTAIQSLRQNEKTMASCTARLDDLFLEIARGSKSA